ncbi:MAG: tetratricopeptide repeat protein [Planctomycetaceae bacterium]
MQTDSSSPRLLPIIRLFVSSTFSDLKHERNALQRKVFPELEQICSSKGFQFQAIDLRWGVPTEAGLDHRTMRICFEELRRSQEVSPLPNFLILLGDRYGWRPLPETISVAEFDQLKKVAAQIEVDESARLRENDNRLCHAVRTLEQWYLLDENACPAARATTVSTRESKLRPDGRDSLKCDEDHRGEYVLRSRIKKIDGIDYGKVEDSDGTLRDAQAWVDVQFVLWSIVNRAFPAADLATRFQPSTAVTQESLPSIVRFQASATEQEIWHGALNITNANEHVVAVIRKIDNLNEFSGDPRCRDFVDLDDKNQVDRDSANAQAQLQNELRSRLSHRDEATSKGRRTRESSDRSLTASATAEIDAPKLRHVYETQGVMLRKVPSSSCRDRQGAVDAGDKQPLPHARGSNDETELDVTTDHLDNLCQSVLNHLKPIIQTQINDYKKPKFTPDSTVTTTDSDRALRDLELEREAHQRFADERAPVYVDERGEVDGVVGREQSTQEILNYLSRDDSRLLVVHGASGSGKTALMARAARISQRSRESEAPAEPRETVDIPTPNGPEGALPSQVETPQQTSSHPSSPVNLVRFLGATAKSSDLRSLLVNLCAELRLAFSITGELPTDIQELKQEFYNLLGRATENQPIHIFLDALDQLEDADGARQLTWLRSTPLPSHAKLVVSCLSDLQDDEEATLPYNVLKQRDLLANQVAVDSLSFDEAHTLLFNIWLPQAGRTVSETQRNAILNRIQSHASEAATVRERIESLQPLPDGRGSNKSPVNDPDERRSPLYLKILFEEARRWRSFDDPPQPGGSVSELLEQFFDRLSLATNHGPLLVRRALGYIAAARRGLSETEILEVLFADPDYKKQLDEASERNKHALSTVPPRIPIAIWSRLRCDLAPYLTERSAPGGNVLTLYHRQLAQWGKAHFVDGCQWNPHERLADYLATQAMTDRQVDELPWQLCEAQLWQRLYDFLAEVPYFLAVWKANEFDLKRYWTLIESHSNLRLVQAYHPVIVAPAQHGAAVWALAILMGDKGHRTETLLLREWQVEHYREIDDPRTLARCLIALGDSLQARGDYERAHDLYDEAEQICQRLGDRDELATCLGSQALLRQAQGELDAAMNLLHRQTEICCELPTKRSLQYNLGHKAGICFLQGKFQEALTFAIEQEQAALELGNIEVVAAALGYQSKVFEALNQPENAVRLCRERQRLWRELGNPEMLAMAMCDQALIDQMGGNLHSALSLYQQARVLTRGLPDTSVYHNAFNNEAVLRESLGDYSAAMTLYRESEDKSRKFGMRAQLARTLSNQVDILVATKDLGIAMEKAREAEEICRESGDTKALVLALQKRSLVHVTLQEFSQALLVLQEWEKLLEDSHDRQGISYVVHNQAVVLAYAGDFRESLSVLAREEQILRGLGKHLEQLVQCLQMQAEVAQAYADSLPALGPVDPSASLFEQHQRNIRKTFIERVRSCRREIGRIGLELEAQGRPPIVARRPTLGTTILPLIGMLSIWWAAWAGVAYSSWLLVIAIPMTIATILFACFYSAWLHGFVTSAWCPGCGKAAWRFGRHYRCECGWKVPESGVPLDPDSGMRDQGER